MYKHFAGLFNNLPIYSKLLLISTIPLASLICISVVIYINVQIFSLDEERLNNLYLAREAAAQYMRLVVELESGFRGYMLTEDVRDLRPYQEALENVRGAGQALKERLSENQQRDFQDAEALVNRIIAEKEGLIADLQAGRKSRVLQYLNEERGRALMTEFRVWMTQLDTFEEARAREGLAQMSQDRMSTLLAIFLYGGFFTLAFIICAPLLIARSIAVPLVNLSKALGDSSGAFVPIIPVLDRKDEIGGLTRVMQEMSRQIRDHVGQVIQSEASLRTLNQELSASESRYRGLVDHAPIGIFTTKGMQITFSNRHNQVLAGLDPDEQMDPGAFRERMHPEDRERLMSSFSRAVAECREYEMIFRFIHADGGVLNILSRRVPISGVDSPDPIYVGFNIDITAMHSLQLRLSRTEKLATLGQMAAGIAHELRNPLVGIGSTASLLLDEFERSDPRRAEIDVILQEIKRLDRIVSQIVEYARPRGLTLSRFVLSDLINEVVKVLSGPLEVKHVKIKTLLSAIDDHLFADRDQVKQVLINVIDNAIDASVDGSVIDIRAHESSHDEQPGRMIQVQDNGKGMSPDVLSRVFEPFFTSGKRHGTGLGMAVCKNIVESHRGDIHLTSAVGEGTIVSIWFPHSQMLSR